MYIRIFVDVKDIKLVNKIKDSNNWKCVYNDLIVVIFFLLFKKNKK